MPGLPHHAAPRQRIEPLSAARYRVQFTVDLSLKQKLELARDLLRHAHPSGDLGPIVERALDLLLQQLLERRFGARRKGHPPRRAVLTATHSAATHSAPTSPSAATHSAASHSAPTSPSAAPPGKTPSRATPSHIARAARRAVLERDGLGCAWVDATGKRCCSTAWLELDHQHPSGKGGSSGPDNLRWLCRAHNRFAAERAYGRAHVEGAIRARQRLAAVPPCSARRAELVDAGGAVAPVGVDALGPAGSTES
ncbi:MAG TPA: HNH endonuclease signature motif containing protein [Polyangiaceae bacterium]|nr:HNH endonuclease signature motif containing protein [Polyangiaceae bacterium]